jgi:hypothetical protein
MLEPYTDAELAKHMRIYNDDPALDTCMADAEQWPCTAVFLAELKDVDQHVMRLLIGEKATRTMVRLLATIDALNERVKDLEKCPHRYLINEFDAQYCSCGKKVS